jgi:homoserine kinase
VDHVIEPQRKHLIPHFETLKETALTMGALGCSISGAGPAVFALCQEKTQAAEIGGAMKKIYDQHKIESRILTGGINQSGTVVM